MIITAASEWVSEPECCYIAAARERIRLLYMCADVGGLNNIQFQCAHTAHDHNYLLLLWYNLDFISNTAAFHMIIQLAWKFSLAYDIHLHALLAMRWWLEKWHARTKKNSSLPSESNENIILLTRSTMDAFLSRLEFKTRALQLNINRQIDKKIISITSFQI